MQVNLRYNSKNNIIRPHKEYYDFCGLTPSEYKEYHPEDYEYTKQCGGWKDFCKNFSGKLAEFPIREHSPNSEGVFSIKELSEKEVITVREIIPVLTMAGQFLFQKLGLQAQKNINTERVERELLQLKKIFRFLLSEKPEYVIVLNKEEIRKVVHEANMYTSLTILRQIVGSSSQYLFTEEGKVINFSQMDLLDNVLLFLLPNPPEELVPLPLLQWTENELIAIHSENIPMELIEKIETKAITF